MTWSDLIREEEPKAYYQNLKRFVTARRLETTVFPPKALLFRAFDLCPFEKVKVVILGQDPYHGDGQAMGLSFSVPNGIALPPSLINIFKELEDDCGIRKQTGDLSGWAKQGVFLLNTLLTVEKGRPMSHQGKGWEEFTDTMIRHLSQRDKPIIFVLWGKQALSKRNLIARHHIILQSVHPSPLSAYRGFFGSRPFSRINKILSDLNETEIDWSL